MCIRDRGAASRVGMLFQHGALFSAFNVLDNVAFALREQGTLPAELVRDAAMVKLQMVGLEPEHATRMPADLSGGMIKRVALARALIMDPPLLLLDEPTAGLDPYGADEFCELVRELHDALGPTMVMVTHDLDTLFALATRVAVLADRKVIVTGAPAEVAHFAHPFVEHYFLGERGRRAMAQRGAVARAGRRGSPAVAPPPPIVLQCDPVRPDPRRPSPSCAPVSYTHLRAHETVLDLVCRLLLEKKNSDRR